jgi:uncharacterized protein (TIGR03083 family)
MAKTDVWPTIHAERKALAVDLDGLDDEAWDTRSLCSDWTVRDVVAHMTASAKIKGPQFFVKLIGSGLSLTRLQAKDIAVERGTSPAETLDRFKAAMGSTSSPPGPVETPLGEVIVHSEDIRRSLGIKHEYPTEAATRVADFYRRSNLIIGGKRRVAGLTLRATDVSWERGSGPRVSGPIVALVLAITGRVAALDELTGDGVAMLRTRAQS